LKATFHVELPIYCGVSTSAARAVCTNGSQSGGYRSPGVNWTIQGVDKLLRGRIVGHWMARGSMKNCCGLLEIWSFEFKIIVNRARNANGLFLQIKQIKRVDQISPTVV